MHPCYEPWPLEATGLQAGPPSQQLTRDLDMEVEEVPEGQELSSLPQEKHREDIKESHKALENDQCLVERDQMAEGSAGTGTKGLEQGVEHAPGGDRELPELGVWPEKVLSCSLCKRLFSNLQDLRQHEYHHSLSLNALSLDWPIPTPQSNQSSQSLQLQQSHYRPALAEPAPTRYFCPQCPASFTLKSNADRHEKTIHMKKKLMQCVHCLKHFRDRTDIHRHLSSVHSKEREHPCPSCNKAFSTQKNLSSHIKVCCKAGAVLGPDVSQVGDNDSLWWFTQGVSSNFTLT